MRVERRFILARDDQDDAYAMLFRLADVLVKAGAVERYRLSVRRIPAGRGLTGWGVYLTDRTPELGAPVGLSFGPLARRLALAA